MVLGLQQLATMITPRNRRQQTAPVAAASKQQEDPFLSSSDEEEEDIPMKSPVTKAMPPSNAVAESSLAAQMKEAFSSSDEDEDDSDDDVEGEEEEPTKRTHATEDKPAATTVDGQSAAKENMTPKRGNQSNGKKVLAEVGSDKLNISSIDSVKTSKGKSAASSNANNNKNSSLVAKSKSNTNSKAQKGTTAKKTAAAKPKGKPKSPVNPPACVLEAATSPATGTNTTPDNQKKPAHASNAKKRKADVASLTTPSDKKAAKAPTATTITSAGKATSSTSTGLNGDGSANANSNNEGATDPQPKTTTKQQRQRKKRQPPLQQTQEDSVQLAQAYAALTETVYKAKQDAFKKAEKELKRKGQELQDYERHVASLLVESIQALDDKRSAAKQHKALLKQWEKLKTSIQSTEEATQRKLESAMAAAKEGKGTSAPCSKKRRVSLDKDDADDESVDRDSSEDDDSDWEGAKKSNSRRKSSTKAASPEAVAVARDEPVAPKSDRLRRKSTTSWICPRCTLKNTVEDRECAACEVAKPSIVSAVE